MIHHITLASQPARTRWFRILTTLFVAGWGAALPVLILWGPVSLTGWPVYLAGVLGATALGSFWLWLYSYEQRAPEKARNARRWIGRLSAIVILFAAGLTIYQLRFLGIFPLPSMERTENFEHLWRVMQATYPYSDEKGVDWEVVYSEYAPRVQTAGSDEEYQAVIGEMLAGLGDAHTQVFSSQSQFVCCLAVAEEIEGKAIVTRSGELAKTYGLVPGSQIVSINAKPVEEVNSEKQSLQSYSTTWQARYITFLHLLSVPELGDQVEVSFIPPDGSLQTVVLTYDPKTFGGNQGGASQAIITGKCLSSGLGYIRIPTFSSNGHDLVAEFDTALADLMDTPGLILDVRGNGGGSTMLSDPMAGRFLEEKYIYGRDYFAYRSPLRLWRSWLYFQVLPRQPIYQGELAILIDEGSLSTTEEFLVALVDSGRAITIGHQTGGGSGNPMHFQLPGAEARFSTADFRRNNGQPIEGVGLLPDYKVDKSIGDMVNQRDPFLETAEKLLLEKAR